MTQEEVDSVIRGFYTGGSMSESAYPPGERIKWFYDPEQKCFCQRIQTIDDESVLHHTEEYMRKMLATQQHK